MEWRTPTSLIPSGRGTRSCRGMGRGTAEAVRASTRARCARLSMRLVGKHDYRASEAMRMGGGVANPNLPHPEPAAGRGRVEGWAGARPTPWRASTPARCARLSMRLVGKHGFRAREAMRGGENLRPLVSAIRRHAGDDGLHASSSSRDLCRAKGSRTVIRCRPARLRGGGAPTPYRARGSAVP